MLKRNKRIAQICAAAMCMSLFQGVGNGYIKTYAEEKEDVSITAEAVVDSEVTEGVSVSEEVESDDFVQESDEVSEGVQEVIEEENESIEENEIKQEDEVIENNNVTDNNEDTEITEESVESYDAAVSIDGLQYEIIDDTSVAVSKNTSFSTGEIVIPKKVEIEGKKYIVTSIKGFAFSNSKCSKVVIPNTVTSIGSHAFYYINSDAVIEVGCNRVKGLILNSSSEVRENQIKVISNDQTGDEESLESLNYTIIDGTSVSVSGLDFNNTKLVIPEKVTLEGKEYNVTEIDSNGFLGNATIKEVIIPGSVKKIGKNAFNGCSELYKVILKDGVETIESGAFVNDDIIKVMIPQSLVNIEQNSFEKFTYYTNFVVALEDQKNIITSSGVYDPNVTVSAEQVDNNWVWDKELESYKSYRKLGDSTVEIYSYDKKNNKVDILNKIFIGDKEYTITRIGDFAFANNTDIERLYISNNIKSIGESAFNGCSNLTSFDKWETNLNSIGNCAFAGCSKLENNLSAKEIGEFAYKDCVSLKNIYLYNDVENIGNGAFWYCINADKVTIDSEDVNIGSGSFFSMSNSTFHVKNENVKQALIDSGVAESQIVIG